MVQKTSVSKNLYKNENFKKKIGLSFFLNHKTYA